MIEVDRLVLYKCLDKYKFAIVNKDKTKVALVVDDKVMDFDEKKLFTFKYIAGNPIDDEWEVSSHSFKDFLHIALADSDRTSLVYPSASMLPKYTKFQDIKNIISCVGITLGREDLKKIEKYLNKIVFKKLIKQEEYQEQKDYIEYSNF